MTNPAVSWEAPKPGSTWGVDVTADLADPNLYHFVVCMPLDYITLTFTVNEPPEPKLPWDGWPLGDPNGEA